MEYETLGKNFQDEEVATAFCAVVNARQLASPSTVCMSAKCQPSDDLNIYSDHSIAISAQSSCLCSILLVIDNDMVMD